MTGAVTSQGFSPTNVKITSALSRVRNEIPSSKMNKSDCFSNSRTEDKLRLTSNRPVAPSAAEKRAIEPRRNPDRFCALTVSAESQLCSRTAVRHVLEDERSTATSVVSM